MDSNLCIICFVNDDHHQVNVGEKGLETLLWYIKLHFDDKLERLFSKSSQWFKHAICRHDYTNDQRFAHAEDAPPNKKIKLRPIVRSLTIIFTSTYIYTNMEVFAKTVNGFKQLAIPTKTPSSMFDSVLNTCTQFKMLIHNIKSNSIGCML